MGRWKLRAVWRQRYGDQFDKLKDWRTPLPDDRRAGSLFSAIVATVVFRIGTQ